MYLPREAKARLKAEALTGFGLAEEFLGWTTQALRRHLRLTANPEARAIARAIIHSRAKPKAAPKAA